MSYSQCRQRKASGKSGPSAGMAVLSFLKTEHTVTSEDEEQVTQEGSFNGYSNTRSNSSTLQPFSSIKRTSRMGRLKTAPLPTRLATIKFDEEDDVDIGASESNNEKENVHQISQSTSNIKHFTEPGNYISTEVGSGATTATSMQGPGESR